MVQLAELSESLRHTNHHITAGNGSCTAVVWMVLLMLRCWLGKELFATVEQNGRTVREDSGVKSHNLQSDRGGRSSHTHPTNSLADLPKRHQITHTIMLTDSVKLLQKVESGMDCPDTAKHSLLLPRLVWVYCPGHTRVRGNDRANRLASLADTIPALQLNGKEGKVRASQQCLLEGKEAVEIYLSEVGNDLSSTKRWQCF